MRHGLEAVAQVLAGGNDVLAHVLLDQRADRGAARRPGKGAPTKVEPWSPGAHEVGHLGAGGDGTHGEAVGDALGHAHDVRLDAGALEAERGATAEEAGLDLVDDEQDALLVAEVGDGAQVVVGGRPDTALALDALEHDGADGAAAGSGVLHGLAQRVDVVEVNGGKARRQRLEALVEDVLAGGGERGQRTAVEALVGAHDTRRRRRA